MTCQKNDIYTYGQILTEYEKQQKQEPHNRHIANIYTQIAHKDLANRTENVMYHTKHKKYIKFQETTHKDVYNELIKLDYKEHHSKIKWEERFPNTEINWNQVWNAINNPLTTEDTKTTVWSQIHLNDYTTYSYNKWHNTQQKCPFCLNIPQDRYHITTECPILTEVWNELETHLQNIHPTHVTNYEKVFGITGNTPNVTLRNWMTFLMRQCIFEQESIAYHNKKGHVNKIDLKLAYNQRVKNEVWNKYNIYSNLGKSAYFAEIFAVNNYLITWENEQWQILTLFKVH